MIRKQTTFIDLSLGRDRMVYNAVTKFERELVGLTRYMSVYAEEDILLLMDKVGALFQGAGHSVTDHKKRCLIAASRTAYRTEILLKATEEADREHGVVRPVELTMSFYRKRERQPFMEIYVWFDDNAGRIYRITVFRG